MKKKDANLLLSLFVMPGIGQFAEERWKLGMAFLLVELVLLGWVIYVVMTFALDALAVVSNPEVAESTRDLLRAGAKRMLLPLVLMFINRFASGIEAYVRTQDVSDR